MHHLLLAPLPILLALAAPAAAQGLQPTTSCATFSRVEAADRGRGADRDVTTADAAALLSLIAPTLPSPPSAPVARAAIARLGAWCSAHPAAPLAAAIAQTPARWPPPPPSAPPQAASGQAASLFARACMVGAGRPAALRAWAGEHRLPRLPAPAAASFAEPGRPAQVFDAGTPDGKMALISDDDGSCAVAIPAGTQATAQAALETLLSQQGVVLTPIFKKADRSHAAAVRLYRAAAQGRSWLLGVESTADRYGQSDLAEIRLTATVAPAR